jgi:hypothetical protein
MKHVNLRHVCAAAAIAIVAVTIDHASRFADVEAQGVRGAPSDAAAPGPVDNLRNAVRQTAAVVEGWVTNIQHEFSEENGPWTRVTLSNVHAHLGSAPLTVEIRHFGGPLPNGRFLVAAELPVFVLGKQYVVFLRNTAWNVSPVVGDLALRVETLDGTEVLVNSDGQPVTEVGAQGLELGAALFEGPLPDGRAPAAVGRRLQDLGRRPLDRGRFVQELRTHIAAQGARVSGAFYEHPAGGFRWRGQRTARAADERESADPAGAGSSGPEVDTSGSSR